MSKQGKRNEYEFMRSLRAFGEAHPTMWYRRWPDYMDFIRVHPALRAPRAPCDYVAVYRGLFYALEVKSTRGTRFLHSWIKPHQIESLRHVKAAGGMAFIVFMHRQRPIRCWAIDIDNYLKVRSAFSKKGRKSVTVEAMGKIGVPLPRLRGMFDASPLFGTKPPKTVRGVKVKK